MISFAGKVKSELCRMGISRLCCARAEGYGVLLYCNTFMPGEVRIITESGDFAARLPKLFHKAFSLKFDQLPEHDGRGKLIFRITDRDKLARVINTLGYDPQQIMALHVNFGLLEEDCCRTAFLRGAFLAGGSVTAPSKNYHLELITAHASVSRETAALLTELGFAARSIDRGANTVLYFKKSEAIEDFLTKIGAPCAAMDIMSAKVEKSMNNSINRKVNCDTANADKVVAAAQEQIDAIRRIERDYGLDVLPEKLQSAALLRIANPEASLADLATLSYPPVTKSCLNYRLKKLMEFHMDD